MQEVEKLCVPLFLFPDSMYMHTPTVRCRKQAGGAQHVNRKQKYCNIFPISYSCTSPSQRTTATKIAKFLIRVQEVPVMLVWGKEVNLKQALSRPPCELCADEEISFSLSSHLLHWAVDMFVVSVKFYFLNQHLATLSSHCDATYWTRGINCVFPFTPAVWTRQHTTAFLLDVVKVKGQLLYQR